MSQVSFPFYVPIYKDKVEKGKSIPVLQSLGKGVSSRKKQVVCWQPQKDGK
jgi:hypothetical protein